MSSTVGASSSSQVLPEFPTNFTGAWNANDPLVSTIWGGVIEGVGQRFSSAAYLRVQLEKFAMAHKFKYRFEKNNGQFVKAKCEVDDCPWKLRASKVRASDEFHIYKFEPKHVHVSADEFVYKFRVSKKLVSNIVEERIRGTSGYTPKQIVKDFNNDYGVELQYVQAWRGKELATEALHGSTVDSYRRLPFLCQKIQDSNPGSVAFMTTEGGRFHQCFVAFRASINGFLSGCRPLLFIDGTFLKAKYKGMLLSAQGCDANNGMYPVAFAIVSGETYIDWSWFMNNLMSILNTDKEIIIISDRNQNIIAAVRDVFGEELHAHCFRHIEQNVFDHVRGTYLTPINKESLKNAMWKAACARLPPDYDKAMQTIKNISPKAHKYLEDNKPEHWAVTKFPRRRWDQMTSNMAETFNNWIMEARELPIYSLIDNIRIKMMTLISRRQEERWKCLVGPRIDHEMKIRLSRSSSLHFYQSTDVDYEVRGGEISHCVNIQERHCSCLDWFHSGLPCVHACTVLKGLEMNPYEFVDPCYRRETQEQIYMHPIKPIETWERQTVVDEAPLNEVPEILPPLTRVRSGRPKKKRRIESQEVPKRLVHCSRCGQEGHYRRTCDRPI